jgi:hypothetical protein
MPVGDPAAAPALDFNSQTDMLVAPVSRRKARPPQRRWGFLIGMLALGAVVLGGAVWGGIWLVRIARTQLAEEETGPAIKLMNAQFTSPGPAWKRDKPLEVKLKVNLVLNSPERNNSLAIYFKDYKTRMPGEAEQVDEALAKLRGYFKGLEWEAKAKDESLTLGGKPALVIEFEGDDPSNVAMNGECYILAFRGYGYWFFTWGPRDDKDLLSPEWASLRRQFTVLESRKGWTEKPRETEKVQGEKIRYQLSCAKGLWTKEETAKDFDPQADVVLRGDEPDPDKRERRGYAGRAAFFQVLVLPRQEDLKAATAAAREYLQNRQKEDYPRTKIEAMKDKNGDEVARTTDIGNAHGHLSKLYVQNTEDRERFVILAVVNRPEGGLVLQGECDWNRRDFWDLEFTTLIDSLKLR